VHKTRVFQFKHRATVACLALFSFCENGAFSVFTLDFTLSFINKKHFITFCFAVRSIC